MLWKKNSTEGRRNYFTCLVWNTAILFITDCMMLCFWFVSKTVLIKHWWLSCCWTVLTLSQGLFITHSAQPVCSLGMHEKLRGDITGTADLNWPKGYPIPYYVILSNKRWERKVGRRWCSELQHLIAQICLSLPHGVSSTFLEMADHLPGDGKQWINSLFLFAFMHNFCLIL